MSLEHTRLKKYSKNLVGITDLKNEKQEKIFINYE